MFLEVHYLKSTWSNNEKKLKPKVQNQYNFSNDTNIIIINDIDKSYHMPRKQY